MTTNHKPTTPLPWNEFRFSNREWTVRGRGALVCQVVTQDRSEKNAAYIAHAANAYPRLIEALRETARALSWHSAQKHAMSGDSSASKDARALLRELGEE